MSETTDIQTAKTSGDLVLREVWRIKDNLSASYDHDVARLFEETRRREAKSNHRLVEPPSRLKAR